MRIIQTFALLLMLTASAFAQLSGFSNLNFELAHIDQSNPSDPATALPSWTVGGTVAPMWGEIKYFFYDGIALDAWAVSIHDGKGQYSFAPLDGQYSIYLQSGRVPAPGYPNGFYGSASIAQTATVPSTANSLLFSANQLFGPMELSLQGHVLPYYKMEDRGSYSIYGADISAFAGQMSELKFGSGLASSVFLDDIQFSSQVIPEPATLSLIASGLILSLVRFRAKRA